MLAGLIIALAGVLLGAWWAPFLVGAAFGFAVRRVAIAVPLGGLCGLFAWLGPVVGLQIRYGLGPTSSSLAAMVGFDHQGAVPVVLTLLIGLLLGLSGAWFANSTRALAVTGGR